jgi:hypothetical protein
MKRKKQDLIAECARAGLLTWGTKRELVSRLSRPLKMRMATAEAPNLDHGIDVMSKWVSSLTPAIDAAM